MCEGTVYVVMNTAGIPFVDSIWTDIDDANRRVDTIGTGRQFSMPLDEA